MYQMKLAHLRTLVAIVDSGGFTRAAVQLNLTQSAASRQIHALEAELGVALFGRIGRDVQLTAEGEDLLQRCRRVLAEVEAIGERAHLLKAGETGLLRVGATPQGIETVLATFLPLHRQRHPGIQVHLVEDGGTRLPGRLERGEVQVATMPAGHDRFQSRPLYPIHVMAVLSKTHRLSRRVVLDISHLADEPLLLLRREFASRDWFDAACRVAQIRPRVLLESAAPHTVIALAEPGYGIAVVPSNVHIARGSVRAVPLVHRGASIGRWVVAAWDPQRFLAPYAQRFIEELVSFVQRDYPGQEFARRAPPLPIPKAPATWSP
jgi:LysR family transcriptional regulator, cyn operon transcriptional activator